MASSMAQHLQRPVVGQPRIPRPYDKTSTGHYQLVHGRNCCASTNSSSASASVLSIEPYPLSRDELAFTNQLDFIDQQRRQLNRHIAVSHMPLKPKSTDVDSRSRLTARHGQPLTVAINNHALLWARHPTPLAPPTAPARVLQYQPSCYGEIIHGVSLMKGNTTPGEPIGLSRFDSPTQPDDPFVQHAGQSTAAVRLPYSTEATATSKGVCQTV